MTSPHAHCIHSNTHPTKHSMYISCTYTTYAYHTPTKCSLYYVPSKYAHPIKLDTLFTYVIYTYHISHKTAETYITYTPPQISAHTICTHMYYTHISCSINIVQTPYSHSVHVPHTHSQQNTPHTIHTLHVAQNIVHIYHIPAHTYITTSCIYPYKATCI